MKKITSDLLNGAKCLCETYIDYRNECTQEISQLRAEIVEGRVKFILSLRCRDTHDWDKAFFWVDLELGECNRGEWIYGKNHLIDDDGSYMLKLSLVDDQIVIEAKQEFYTWARHTRKNSMGIYQKVPFKRLSEPFIVKAKDFFEQVEGNNVKYTYNVSVEQYDLLTSLLTPLKDNKLRENVKDILTNSSERKGYFGDVIEEDDDFLNELKIEDSVNDFRELKARIEWINGFYINRKIDDSTDPIDVLMVTMGWHALGEERRVVDLMQGSGKVLGLKRVAEMLRVPLKDAKRIMGTYKSKFKQIDKIRSHFATNESMHWNP